MHGETSSMAEHSGVFIRKELEPRMNTNKRQFHDLSEVFTDVHAIFRALRAHYLRIFAFIRGSKPFLYLTALI
ncbi:hypothetical protein ABAC402_05045 [Asticcacaulis sp. AC402]|nr:hypothetical protein ABAC402_05045 [Asticcacaulis sp. AC402]